ncbi:MAG: GntR family transcriptional regulator [Lachnospiraceae bacterium]
MLLALDFSLDTPIYQQIRNQIVLGIAEGRLLPGEKLPPIRLLAEETGVNVMTVNKAYQLLKQEGYLMTDRRNGAVISPNLKELPSSSFSEEKDSTSYQTLKLLLSELYVGGVPREELLAACNEIYDELSKKGGTSV